jgi:hypothetical protein
MKISAIIADANGALLTGKAASTALKVLRAADGYLIDWSDLTFKASGWGSLTTPLVEVDSTNLPGGYQKDVTITAWADGFYRCLVHFDDATTVLNFQGEQYIQGGREVEVNCDAAMSSRALEAGGNLEAIKADVVHATYGLNALLTAIGARMATFTYTAPDSAATIATAVWANATRTLSSFGSLVGDAAAAVWAAATRALTDKAGFSISGTKQTLDALQDLSQTGAQAGAAAALIAYDPPTRAEATADKAEVAALVEKIRKAHTNRLVVDPVTGAFTIYDDNGATPLITGTISGTGRSVPVWP